MDTQTKSLTVTSQLKNIRKVVSELMDFVTAKTGIDENALPTVLSEAVTNAMVHGNKSDPDKKVFAEAWITPEKLIFKISDEGKGFDYRKLPDPTKSENLKKTHGRGLYLVRNFMDNVFFRRFGSEIIREKYIN
ncbi:MAG: ATP-binding protein [bacterium]